MKNYILLPSELSAEYSKNVLPRLDAKITQLNEDKRAEILNYETVEDLVIERLSELSFYKHLIKCMIFDDYDNFFMNTSSFGLLDVIYKAEIEVGKTYFTADIHVHYVLDGDKIIDWKLLELSMISSPF
ncbi:hypothetical protein [Pedobacter ureilyticus]|uniref:Uncharacterized protein n=1 Tax=Pedobacter ureilyticus TaxID=1393051 RepID=A0ABW9J514_9SPHI|nr:hypothetical protein [Pedobacter helvus]